MRRWSKQGATLCGGGKLRGVVGILGGQYGLAGAESIMACVSISSRGVVRTVAPFAEVVLNLNLSKVMCRWTVPLLFW